MSINADGERKKPCLLNDRKVMLVCSKILRAIFPKVDRDWSILHGLFLISEIDVIFD